MKKDRRRMSSKGVRYALGATALSIAIPGVLALRPALANEFGAAKALAHIGQLFADTFDKSIDTNSTVSCKGGEFIVYMRTPGSDDPLQPFCVPAVNVCGVLFGGELGKDPNNPMPISKKQCEGGGGKVRDVNSGPDKGTHCCDNGVNCIVSVE